MIERRHDPRRSHAVSGAFVFLLLGVFAVFSTVMVLLGAQLYRVTVQDSARHSAQRVAQSYLLNVVRGNDIADSVSLRSVDGVSMLVMAWDGGDEIYETSIYCYDGALRELFADAEDEFRPDYGETICAAQALEFQLDGNLLTMKLTDPEGQEQILHAALRCGAAGGEAQS